MHPLLESVVLAALITVLIGGLFGSLITYILERRGKEREYRQSIIKSRSDLAISSYKEYLDQEQNAVNRAYGIIGNCIAAADRLVYLTEERWKPKKADTADDKKVIDAAWDETIEHFTETKTKWNNEKEALGQLMDYYHPDNPQVVEAWDNLQNSVDAYLTWADALFESHRTMEFSLTTKEIDAERNRQMGDPSNPAEEKSEPPDIRLMPRLKKFTAALKSSRSYPWKWLLSPEVEKELSNTE